MKSIVQYLAYQNGLVTAGETGIVADLNSNTFVAPQFMNGTATQTPLTLTTPANSNPGLLIVENNVSSFDLVIAHAKPGAVAATFQTGTLFTATGIISSGLFAGTIDANGNLSITNFGLDKLNGVPTMITTVSDVLGPNIANELSTAYNAGTGAYFELNVDNAGVYIHTVEADGSHYWGLGSTHASLDTGLRRLSAGNLQVQNGAANNATATLTVGQLLVSDFAGNNKGGILSDGSFRLVAGAGFHFDPVTPGTTTFLLYDAGTTSQLFLRDSTNGRMQNTWTLGTAGNASEVILDNLTVTAATAQTADVLDIKDNLGNLVFVVDPNSNVVAGKSAPATTATNGFLYIPAMAGAPTGTPTAKTGYCPHVYDTTNHKLWVYDTAAAAWKGIVLT